MCASKEVVQALRRLVALAMTLFLLLPAAELFAQGPPDQRSGYRQLADVRQPYQAYGQTNPHEGYAQPQRPPLNAEQLVAPIALYPDTLVAQVLVASTYPAQVADADHWRQAQGLTSPDQIAAGVDEQTWDPAVKALTAFPQVLAQMDGNLPWTTDLGNAYYNEPQEVFDAVQEMRQRAEAAGNLRSSPQETVSYDQGNIELAPADPQMVYVPAYNPWDVYGQPVSPYPGFSLIGALGSFLGSSPLSYGLGIAMTAFTHAPWGWLAWGLSWLTQSVLFNQDNYYSNSNSVAHWGGGLRGSSRAGVGSGFPNGSNRTPRSYSHSGGGYHGTHGWGFVPRPPNRIGGSYGRPGGAYGATLGHGFVPRPPNRMGGSYGWPGGTYSAALGRGFVPRPSGRSGAGYGSSQRAYRGPAASFQHSNFGTRSSGAFAGRGYAGSSGKPAHSGGFHLFGGGHSSQNLHGGGHAPRSFGGGKSFSSGHSGGGGHSGGHSSGKHHR
jgi:hypothetical protein